MKHQLGKLAVATVMASMDTQSFAWTCGGYELHAHRGAASQPENSASAIRAALDMNFQAVELDLQQLADGNWVIHHDPVLGRVVSVPPDIRRQGRAAVTLKEIDTRQWLSATLFGRDGRPSGEEPATLDSALKAADKKASAAKVMHLEVKSKTACNDLKALHSKIADRIGSDAVIYSSFDLAALSCLRSADRSVYLGVLIGPEPKSAAQSAAFNPNLQPHLQKAKELASRFGAFAPKAGELVRKVEASYESSFNRRYLESGAMPSLMRSIGGRVGVHLDAATAAVRPQTIGDAMDAGAKKVLTYSTQGDVQHIKDLQALSRAGGKMPGGMIIEGDPVEFCNKIASVVAR